MERREHRVHDGSSESCLQRLGDIEKPLSNIPEELATEKGFYPVGG